MVATIKTCNSISGGRTSCYMAVHYPVDINIFACVLTNDKACEIKDKGLLREIRNKLPQFEGSRELDQTLINVLRLEQEIGKEIKWLAADFTYDELIQSKKYLPSKFNRTSPVELKIKPICYYLYLNYGLIIQQIGFRADEYKRIDNMMAQCDKAYTTKIPISCLTSKSRRQNYQDVEWRLPVFPLAENGITNKDVVRYWDKRGWDFPPISNCDFCFFHKRRELSEQRDSYPERFKWWAKIEADFGFTFGDKKLENLTDYSQMTIFDDSLNFACSCTD